MAPPTQMDRTEQDTLVKQIGISLLRSAPHDWQRITANYRTVGRYHELDGEVTLADGTSVEWIPTHDIGTLFGQLRAGMYREERGTWFNAHYQLDAPANYNLEYDRDEPEWDLLPPPQAYADELRMFPRSEDNVPDWLIRRLAGLGPERPGPRFRMARIFDGTGPTGRPAINRPELDVDEQDRLLAYLGAAPVVMPGSGYDIDRLAATPEGRVPVAFHSDGTWIWPAAVNYYLHEYGVPPEPELVEHIKSNAFEVGEVSEEQRAAAHDYLTRSSPPPPPVAPDAPAMPRMPPAPPGRPAPPVAPPIARHGVEPGGQDDQSAHRAAQANVGTGYYDVRQDLAEDGADAADADPALTTPPAIARMRAKLDELGVPATAYRVGEPAINGWSIESIDAGWRVGWYDHRLVDSATFDNPDDAAAFMLGKLLLAPPEPAEERGIADALAAEPEPPQPSPQARPEPAQQASFEASGPPPRVDATPPPTVYEPRGGPSTVTPHGEPGSARAASGAGATWPIQPLPGEPPLTLFRGKSIVELPPGSELDRFGGPDGNLTYAAGTPFEERSLVPEWISRPYHVYRVQRHVEALSGVAIPWFNQPGGGSGYVLPASIEDLVADGVLIELDPGDPPID